MLARPYYRPIDERGGDPYTKPYKTRKQQPTSASTRPEQGIEVEDGDCQVTVTSAQAARNADVILVVYGNHGNTGSIILGSAGRDGMFSEGKQDEFKVKLTGIGKIFKIRLELLAKEIGRIPYWKPKEVKLRDLSTKEVLKFKCPHALSYREGHGGGVCELPAVRPGQTVPPVVSYLVKTHTSALPGADTDANVYVTIFGDRGDTGKRPLMYSDQEDKFQGGQVDTFTLEAVALGPIKRLLLCHDGEGPGEGWKCKQVTVQERGRGEMYGFNCNRWMDTSMDDGRIERLLQVNRSDTVIPKGGGRDRFFHRLTGDRAGGIQPLVLMSEDSDVAFNKKFYNTRNKVQYAIPLSEKPTKEKNNQARPYSHDDLQSEGQCSTPVKYDKDKKKNKMAGYAYLKLPKIESRFREEITIRQDYDTDSDDMTLPNISSVASSLVYNPKPQRYPKGKSKHKSLRRNKEQTRNKKEPENVDVNYYEKLTEDEESLNSSDNETEHRSKPQKVTERQTEEHRHKAESSDKKNGIKQMESMIYKPKAVKNSDLWSDVDSVQSHPDLRKAKESRKIHRQSKEQKQDRYSSQNSDESDPYISDSDASVFSTVSGIKLLRKNGNKKMEIPDDSQFEPVHAVYIGTNKVPPQKKQTDSSPERRSRNDESPRKGSKHEKYHPLINRKGFPWESKKPPFRNSDNPKQQSPRKQEKPKTAVVRPTQRQPDEEVDPVKEKVKREEVDPLKYVPHRIEVRLAERRMRRWKREQEDPTNFTQKQSRLRKWSPKRPRSRTFTINDREFRKKEGVRTAVDKRRPRSRTFTLRDYDVQKKQGVRTDVDIRKPKDRQFIKRQRADQKEAEPGDYTIIPEEEEVKLPSAIEQRIRARQLRRKNRPTTPPKEIVEPVKKKPLKRLRSPPKPKPLTVPVGPFTGASRIEKRLKAKKEREEQKQRQTEELLEKAKKEKKKPKIVEMAPIERNQPATYGEKYHIKKEAEAEKVAQNQPNEIVGSNQLMGEFNGLGKQDNQTDNRFFNFTPPEQSNSNGNALVEPNYGITQYRPQETGESDEGENKNNSSNKHPNNSSSSEATEESDAPVRRKKVEFNLAQKTHGDYAAPPILRFGKSQTIPSPQPIPEPTPIPAEPPRRVSPSPSPDYKPKGAKSNPTPWAKKSYIHDKGDDRKSTSKSSGDKGGGKGRKNWRKLQAVYFVGKNRFFHDYKTNIEYLDQDQNT